MIRDAWELSTVTVVDLKWSEAKDKMKMIGTRY